jgi:hypothetical protein
MKADVHKLFQVDLIYCGESGHRKLFVPFLSTVCPAPA